MLFTLACQSSSKIPLARAKESIIYAVTGDWQQRFFRDAENVVKPLSALEFEAAVQDSTVETIFVPEEAALTLEIAQRILQRNPQIMTIYWEA
jgi:hypothetical protein